MGLRKWILTGLGWSLMGPIGGIIGYLIGASFESTRVSSSGDGFKFATRPKQRYTNTGTVEDITMALLVLMASVMKADKVVKKSELDYVKRFLRSNFNEQQAQTLLLKLRDIQNQEIPLNDVCRQIKYNTDYTTRYHMFDFLYGIADSDGVVSSDEIYVLKTIAINLGINNSDYVSIHARHTASYSDYSSSSSSSAPKKDPYKVLGLDSSATDDEIKKAYRRLAMKYHPDKVEGMGEEVKRNAEVQFREINEAYETLKTLRGIK